MANVTLYVAVARSITPSVWSQGSGCRHLLASGAGGSNWGRNACFTTRGACRKELREVPRHRSEVVRNEEALLYGSDREHIWVAESIELCGAYRLKSIAGSRGHSP